jgi:inorganic pyrophosphatase
MNILKIAPLEDKLLNVVVETPKGCHYKYHYNAESQTFEVKKSLPLGMAFPFDFGFLPNTKAGDGDPTDVLILSDEPSFPGCVVPCRAIGILNATQKEKSGRTVRNDRVIAVADASIMFESINKITQLNDIVRGQLETFFIYYNQLEGKEFKPIEFGGPHKALKAINETTSKD